MKTSIILLLLVAFGLVAGEEGTRTTRAALRGGTPSIPKTSFSCQGRTEGYFADTEVDCGVFHVCQGSGRKTSFFCPKGTQFNQNTKVCDWAYNVRCGDSNGITSVTIGGRGSPNVRKNRFGSARRLRSSEETSDYNDVSSELDFNLSIENLDLDDFDDFTFHQTTPLNQQPLPVTQRPRINNRLTTLAKPANAPARTSSQLQSNHQRQNQQSGRPLLFTQSQIQQKVSPKFSSIVENQTSISEQETAKPIHQEGRSRQSNKIEERTTKRPNLQQSQTPSQHIHAPPRVGRPLKKVVKSRGRPLTNNRFTTTVSPSLLKITNNNRIQSFSNKVDKRNRKRNRGQPINKKLNNSNRDNIIVTTSRPHVTQRQEIVQKLLAPGRKVSRNRSNNKRNRNRKAHTTFENKIITNNDRSKPLSNIGIGVQHSASGRQRNKNRTPVRTMVIKKPIGTTTSIIPSVGSRISIDLDSFEIFDDDSDENIFKIPGNLINNQRNPDNNRNNRPLKVNNNVGVSLKNKAISKIIRTEISSEELGNAGFLSADVIRSKHERRVKAHHEREKNLQIAFQKQKEQDELDRKIRQEKINERKKQQVRKPVSFGPSDKGFPAGLFKSIPGAHFIGSNFGGTFSPAGGTFPTNVKAPSGAIPIKNFKAPGGAIPIKNFKAPSGAFQIKNFKAPSGAFQIKNFNAPSGAFQIKNFKAPSGAIPIKNFKTPNGATPINFTPPTNSLPINFKTRTNKPNKNTATLQRKDAGQFIPAQRFTPPPKLTVSDLHTRRATRNQQKQQQLQNKQKHRQHNVLNNQHLQQKLNQNKANKQQQQIVKLQHQQILRQQQQIERQKQRIQNQQNQQRHREIDTLQKLNLRAFQDNDDFDDKFDGDDHFDDDFLHEDEFDDVSLELGNSRFNNKKRFDDNRFHNNRFDDDDFYDESFDDDRFDDDRFEIDNDSFEVDRLRSSGKTIHRKVTRVNRNSGSYNQKLDGKSFVNPPPAERFLPPPPLR